MEEGSLLQSALSQGDHDRRESNNSSSNNNVLLLDIYSLKEGLSRPEKLLHLAELAHECNHFFHIQSYPWHYGGDGPVFGITTTESDRIPHLRAYCRYGPSVVDEWMAVSFLLQFTERARESVSFAASCWDVEDGQVILIQTADILPAWLDEDSTDCHRHTLWLFQGQVHLFSQPHITLSDALRCLASDSVPVLKSSIQPQIRQALDDFLHNVRGHALKVQRTPLVVPHEVAAVFQKRPDLIHSSAQAFCEHIDTQPDMDWSRESGHWVWTVVNLSRTNYAMLRSMVSPEWTSPEFVPKGLGIEVKHFQRQCARESTPHLLHSVELGVRLSVGLDILSKTNSKVVPLENRIANWCHLDEACRNEKVAKNWILENYELGPNHSNFNLEYLLKCPVFPQEADIRTLYLHPETALSQQIRTARKESADFDGEGTMPRYDEADDDSWLDLNRKEEDQKQHIDLDSLLSNFQSFMTQPSGVEGVTSSRAPTVIRPLEVRPRVFLNILHSALKGEELEFPTRDPFFHQEDYDLMEPVDGDGEQGDGMNEMMEAMGAMDAELEEKSSSRGFDRIEEDDGDALLGQPDEDFAEGAHVLSNLMQSMEASAGASGPVPNMLKEMQGGPK